LERPDLVTHKRKGPVMSQSTIAPKTKADKRASHAADIREHFARCYSTLADLTREVGEGNGDAHASIRVLLSAVRDLELDVDHELGSHESAPPTH